MKYNQLVNLLKQNMPKNLNNIEIAKYIYIELCKNKSFSIEYNYANEDNKSKIYESTKNEKLNLDDMVAKDEHICLSLAYLYMSLLKEWNINSEINDYDTNMINQHIYNLLKIDGKEIYTDITEDLYNIKGGFKTEYFGYNNKWAKSDKVENKKIDQKIGYIKNENDYTDYILEEIKEKTANNNLENSLDYIIKNSDLKKRISPNIKHIENTKILKKILKTVKPNDYGKRLYLFDCYSDSKKNGIKYRPCIIIQENQKANPIPYIYSDKEKSMIKLSFEELDKIVNDGLKIGTNKNVKGANILKKALKKYRTNNKNDILKEI